MISATQLWILFPAFFLAIVASLIFTYRRRLRYINTYVWPPGLIARLQRHHPSLTPTQIETIGLGLKQFFRAYLNGGHRNVAMPSQAVDDLWHEFILYTKAYDEFCQRAFGRFLHHTPAVVLKPNHKTTNEGLRRVWWQTCKEERIDPRAPAALPLLFALDTELNIPNGYRYVPDCGGVRTVSVEIGYGHTTQCGTHFASTSFDGGTDGFGDGDGGGGDGGDGGGCGGD